MLREFFVDDKSILNLEVGAGCGNFGKIFFSECYLTDLDKELKKTCANCSIDYFCDVHKLPWTNDRFDHVIMCNPYGYGFDDEIQSQILIQELVRVSKDNGKLIILCHHTNKYCSPTRVNRRLQNFTSNSVVLSMQEDTIDCATEYTGYLFRTSTGIETKPNRRITIHVTK
ncbi:class I SAM-dependent methyltransferase [Rufibacter ruber]|uniref:class I SAM-dependent methyltransferase n=1 Tax=Rufibacter ruber TaxID=1783499 RepID=UPI000A5FEB4C